MRSRWLEVTPYNAKLSKHTNIANLIIWITAHHIPKYPHLKACSAFQGARIFTHIPGSNRWMNPHSEIQNYEAALLLFTQFQELFLADSKSYHWLELSSRVGQWNQTLQLRVFAWASAERTPECQCPDGNRALWCPHNLNFVTSFTKFRPRLYMLISALNTIFLESILATLLWPPSGSLKSKGPCQGQGHKMAKLRGMLKAPKKAAKQFVHVCVHWQSLQYTIWLLACSGLLWLPSQRCLNLLQQSGVDIRSTVPVRAKIKTGILTQDSLGNKKLGTPTTKNVANDTNIVNWQCRYANDKMLWMIRIL